MLFTRTSTMQLGLLQRLPLPIRMLSWDGVFVRLSTPLGELSECTAHLGLGNLEAQALSTMQVSINSPWRADINDSSERDSAGLHNLTVEYV
jgi:hypothetical protein